MQSSLRNILFNKNIICSCEGTAEESFINLLLDNDKLCFTRADLVNKSITRYRKAAKIAEEFLNQEYERDIAILRIIDREKDKFKLPEIYDLRRDIEVFDIVTKPEIEILHIIAEGRDDKYLKIKRHNRKLKPSEFCTSYFGMNVKNKEFIEKLYLNNVDKLIKAIKNYSGNGYILADLLKE